MALIACRECGKQISDQADVCPSCGIRIQKTQQPAATETAKKKGNMPAIGCLTVIGIIVLIGVIGSNSGTLPNSTQTATQDSESSPSTSPSISVQSFINASSETGTLSIPTEQTGNYDDLCRSEWTKAGVLDQEEDAYCVNQEQQGYNNLVALASNYSNMPNAQPLLDSTITEWIKNGDRDDQEIAYVFGEQISDFKDFRWLASSPGFNEEEGQQCINQWTSGNPQFQDWSEIDYCYKQFPDFKTPSANQ
ncbi:hypothetical protein GCM10010909_35750 [Acidocella aquatica]|uniref:Zinc-ribbon domain-containing protein n=1 Tax=Acidocella aquatica TaxID=1922313 RepID=A0ABQ6AC49_9PROT|nr:hypothetical protein [Acidocella aquatica]GLR68893.1 hypothetical protein GCM10010909_35750 [Acidocella aquatica]